MRLVILSARGPKRLLQLGGGKRRICSSNNRVPHVSSSQRPEPRPSPLRPVPNTRIHTNTVESSFSPLKRGLIGSFHRVSIKHLLRCLRSLNSASICAKTRTSSRVHGAVSRDSHPCHTRSLSGLRRSRHRDYWLSRLRFGRALSWLSSLVSA